jgi:N-acetylmuramic acid 6-phosphate etherase
MTDQDRQALQAVRAAREDIAHLVTMGVDVLRGGGRVHYFGAGSSGRLGVLDAAEVIPTFGVGPRVFVAHLAGGPAAMNEAVEEVEDDADAGALDATEVTGADLAIGLSASGGRPLPRAPRGAGERRVNRLRRDDRHRAGGGDRSRNRCRRPGTCP